MKEKGRRRNVEGGRKNEATVGEENEEEKEEEEEVEEEDEKEEEEEKEEELEEELRMIYVSPSRTKCIFRGFVSLTLAL